jgi:hypothetical protein
MKVALCISGYTRYYYKNIESIKRFLPNSDIFIYTYNTKDHHTQELVNQQEILDLYKPKSIVFQNPKQFEISEEFNEKNIYNKRNINGIISMYYNIYKCNNLKTVYELKNNFTYDAVIRFRSDLELLEPLIINNLDKINIPTYGNYVGTNDQVAFSNSENMNRYSELYLQINNILSTMLTIDPESFMKEHLLSLGIKVRRFNLNYNLLSHGVIRNNLDVEKTWIKTIRNLI